jgi:hypothetical protein
MGAKGSIELEEARSASRTVVRRSSVLDIKNYEVKAFEEYPKCSGIFFIVLTVTENRYSGLADYVVDGVVNGGSLSILLKRPVGVMSTAISKTLDLGDPFCARTCLGVKEHVGYQITAAATLGTLIQRFNHTPRDIEKEIKAATVEEEAARGEFKDSLSKGLREAERKQTEWVVKLQKVNELKANKYMIEWTDKTMEEEWKVEGGIDGGFSVAMMR